MYKQSVGEKVSPEAIMQLALGFEDSAECRRTRPVHRIGQRRFTWHLQTNRPARPAQAGCV